MAEKNSYMFWDLGDRENGDIDDRTKKLGRREGRG